MLTKLAGLGAAGKLALACLGGGVAATACVAAGVGPFGLGSGGDREAKAERLAQDRSRPAPDDAVTVETLPSQIGNESAPPPAPSGEGGGGAVRSEPAPAAAEPAPEPEVQAPAPTVAPTAPPEVQELDAAAAATPPPARATSGDGQGRRSDRGAGGAAGVRPVKARVCLAAMLAVLGLAAAAPSASAAGGQYRVVKCHPWHIEADEVEHAGGHPSYWTVNDCRGTALDPKLGIFNAGAAGNTAYEQFMFSAPPGTHIETACLDHKLRRDGHHRAELLAFPGFRVLATGGDAAGGWVSQCFDLSHSQLILRLACGQAGGCPSGPNAHAYIRNVALAIADDADPVITAFGGDTLGGGWIRGTRTLVADAVDFGAGVFHVVGFVNGVEVGRGTWAMLHGRARLELHGITSAV